MEALIEQRDGSFISYTIVGLRNWNRYAWWSKLKGQHISGQPNTKRVGVELIIHAEMVPLPRLLPGC